MTLQSQPMMGSMGAPSFGGQPGFGGVPGQMGTQGMMSQYGGMGMQGAMGMQDADKQWMDQHGGHLGGHYAGDGWGAADTAGLVSVEVHSVVDVPRNKNMYGKYEQGVYFLQATTIDGKQ